MKLPTELVAHMIYLSLSSTARGRSLVAVKTEVPRRISAAIARNAILLDMDKAKILLTAQAELMRHAWDTFVDESAPVAEGGRRIVVNGCSRCKKRLETEDQYLRHLAKDVLPSIVDLVLNLAKFD
jgi:hypothetical protein